MEGSNPAGARHGPLVPMEGSNGPLPGFGRSSGALSLTESREFKGRPRDNKTIGSVQPKLPFSRSVRVSTGARGVHQATAPSTQLVGCDGDWPACRALSVGTDEKVKPSWRTASSVGGRDARSSMVLSGCTGRVTVTPTVTVWVRDK